MVDAAMQAAYRNAIGLTGELVTFQRISGTAPRTVMFSAQVMANVQAYTPDTVEPSEAGYSSAQPGGITQTDRKVIFIAEDLAAKRFPLPVQKNDKIALANGEKLNVTGVDAHQKQVAGAIVVTAAGIG
jgi:hypothetical protein